MADLNVATPANVVAASGSVIRDVIAGATITQGQVVYSDSAASNKYKLAQADGTVAEANAVGIALNAASDTQPLRIITSGDIDPDATVVVGEVYMVSAAAGGIAPIIDLVVGNFPTILGVGTSVSNIQLRINAAGVVAAAGIGY